MANPKSLFSVPSGTLTTGGGSFTTAYAESAASVALATDVNLLNQATNFLTGVMVGAGKYSGSLSSSIHSWFVGQGISV
jgi:hypothetical protein